MFDILPNNLRFDINSVLRNNKDDIKDIEIEIRLRDNKKDKNLKILEEKLLLDDYKLEKTNTIDYIYNDSRTSYIDGNYFITSKNKLFEKKNIMYDNHNLKLSIAKELMIPTIEPKHYDIIRNKNRKSYTKDNFSIDITEVDGKIEFEIEVINAKVFDFDKLSILLNYVFEILFTNITSVVEDFTRDMGKVEDSVNKIYGSFFSKARDLEFKDLTRDGILKPFTISVKADGKPSFLYFHPLGVYLIDINTEENNCEKISPPIKELNNSLFVGEIISSDNLKKPIEKKFLYLPYDCLKFNNMNIKNHNYLVRYEKCLKINNTIIQDVLIKKKEIIRYDNNVESFNKAIKEIFSRIKHLIYYTDGIIFTPINSPYITNGQKLGKYKKELRVLNKNLDVIKFKLKDDLTIDLLVKADGVYTSNGKFLGTRIFPLKEWSFKINPDMINKIIEFKPVIEKDRIVYIPFRDRTIDKKYPNSKDVAETLWGLRNDPIELDTLEGKNMTLMRKYHNKIKGKIIEDIKGFVIDIGSGPGGDLFKYNKNNKINEILFIEPNEEFIEEFHKRRSTINNLNGKEFRIIQGGGEDTEKIIKEIKEYIIPKMKGDENWNINMMISLSFFWKDKEMLNGLANTINTIRKLYQDNKYTGSVYFNFLTIEGKSLQNLFKHMGKSIKLNDVHLKKVDENQVFINIEDSKTVKNQTEYFVFLNELWDLINFDLLEMKLANNEEKNDFILSTNEKIYSELFVYGKAEYLDNKFQYKCLDIDLGDDKMKKLPKEIEERLGKNDLYRMSTLKEGGSQTHAILKLLNQSYRQADRSKRINLVNDFKIRSLEEIPFGIIVISREEIENINPDKDKKILLLKCDNNEYEAILQIKNRVATRVFN